MYYSLTPGSKYYSINKLFNRSILYAFKYSNTKQQLIDTQKDQ